MPDYEFVILKTHAERANRSARSHAIRTALKQRPEGPNRSSSLYGTFDFNTPSYSELKGRFRLSRNRKIPTSQIHAGSVEPMKYRSAERSEEQERHSFNEQLILGDSSIGLARAKASISTFGNHSADPFNTMPAPFSRRTDLLTKYCTCAIKLNLSLCC
jgi:hypothetical protein